MRRLNKENLDLALNFIEKSGRSIDRALAKFHFGGGDTDAVISALGEWQNEDGGFHGLEQDFRSPASSPMATTMALQVLVDIGVDGGHDMVRQSLDYLAGVRDNEARLWNAVPPDVNDYPHAPWWELNEDKHTFDALVFNPGAEIVSYFLRWPNGMSKVAQEWLNIVLDACDQREALEVHELLCLERLAATPGLPGETRQRLDVVLATYAGACIELNPAGWGDYCVKPMSAAPSPSSPLAVHVAEVVPDQISFELDAQGGDGSWRPHWTWFGNYPDVWAEIEPEIAAMITLQTLCALRAWNAI